MIELRLTTHAFAKTFYKRITKKTLLAKSTHHYCALRSIYCEGVACYAIGAHAGVTNIAKSYLLPVQEVGMLQAIAAQDNSIRTQLLVDTPPLFVKDSSIKLIVTYTEVELKFFFQVAGWHYTGQSHAQPRFTSPDKKQTYDQRNVMHYAKKHGISYVQERDRLLQSGWTQEIVAPRCCYVYLPANTEESLLNMVKQREKEKS